MWKPGSASPAKPKAATATTTTPDSTKKRKTELSGVTRNMRFMQRGRTPPEAPRQPQEVAPMEVDTNTAHEDEDGSQDGAIDNGPSMKTSEETNSTATPTDMYGVEGGVALGRRSFGGFNTVVAENWFRQKQEIFPKPKRKGASKEEDIKILKQFDQMKRNQESRKRSKQQKHSISNGNKKRTKTLEDVLAMTSP